MVSSNSYVHFKGTTKSNYQIHKISDHASQVGTYYSPSNEYLWNDLDLTIASEPAEAPREKPFSTTKKLIRNRCITKER